MVADVLLVQHIFNANHIFNPAGKKISIDALINGEDGDNKCKSAISNEEGRLAQSNDAGVKHTDTIKFIAKQNVPTENKVTYASFACNIAHLRTKSGGYV